MVKVRRGLDINTKIVTTGLVIGAQQALYSHFVPSPIEIRQLTDQREIEEVIKDALLAFGVSELAALAGAAITKDSKVAVVGTISNIFLYVLFIKRGNLTVPQEPPPIL